MRRRIDSRIGEGGEPARQDTRAVRGAVSAEGRRTGLGEVRPPAPGPSGTDSTPIRPPYRQLANDQAGTAPTADRRFVRPAGLAGDPPPGRLLRSCSPIARRPLPAPADAGSLEGGSPGHGPHWSSAACHRRRPARRWADLVVHRSLNRSSTALRDRDRGAFPRVLRAGREGSRAASQEPSGPLLYSRFAGAPRAPPSVRFHDLPGRGGASARPCPTPIPHTPGRLSAATSAERCPSRCGTSSSSRSSSPTRTGRCWS